MKKIMMMAVMAAMSATTAFAQDDLVKQAQKLCDKGEYGEAVKVITPALTSDATKDKAAAWNTLNNICYKEYEHQGQLAGEHAVLKVKPEADSALMYSSIVKALEAAMKCDEYDVQPNEKGKVKIRFRKANQDRYTNGRLGLIAAGQYAHTHKKSEDAQKAWGLYVDCTASPMFEGVDLSKDEYRSQIAYFAGLLAYQNKDYAAATKYAKIAAEDPERKADANEILLFAKKDGAKTKEDTLSYVNTVKELHTQHPEEDRYFNLLMDYYIKSGDKNAMKKWAEEEVAAYPQNKMAWALKGEAEMNSQQWDAAVASYKKAAEIDPTFVQVIFNTGVCLNSKAIELKDKVADKKTGNLTTENFNKVKNILLQSKEYLEKARELDPNREKVNWAYPLYQIYYSLGEKEKSAEMEALLGNN